MTGTIPWTLVLTRLPSEPSRHRVAVWRELRRLGLVPVGSGMWLLPRAEPFMTALQRVEAVAGREGGSVAVLDAAPRDEAAEEVLRSTFARVRVDEWAEFVDDCGKFLAEIDKEFAKRKFTLGELEEEEQSLERLRRWHGVLQERDVLDLPEATTGTAAFERCVVRLGEYAERVMEDDAERHATDHGSAPLP